LHTGWIAAGGSARGQLVRWCAGETARGGVGGDWYRGERDDPAGLALRDGGEGSPAFRNGPDLAGGLELEAELRVSLEAPGEADRRLPRCGRPGLAMEYQGISHGESDAAAHENEGEQQARYPLATRPQHEGEASSRGEASPLDQKGSASMIEKERL
jgi:hypothetical protein